MRKFPIWLAESIGFGILMLCVPALATAEFVEPSSFQALTLPPNELLPSDGNADDDFGFVVAISGDVAIVGARYADTGEAGNNGAAYVYRFDGAGFVEEVKLMPSDLEFPDGFGISVAIDGDIAVVGADRDDAFGLDSGSAYVFRYNGSSWVEETKLLPANGNAHDGFGMSVSIDGNTIVVGAYGTDAPRHGSAYVFRHNGSSWVEEAELVAAVPDPLQGFGFPVSIDGDVVVIGAHTNVSHGSQTGAAYIFEFNGVNWVESQSLSAPGAAAGQLFGVSVSVSGDTVIIGAQGADGVETRAGAAYVFRDTGSIWTLDAKIVALDGEMGHQFGHSVSIEGDSALVGAPLSGSGFPPQTGGAYLFRRNPIGWAQELRIVAPDGEWNDLFGHSCSMSGSRVLVGAIDGGDGVIETGSAYVFDIPIVVPSVAPWGGLIVVACLSWAGWIVLHRRLPAF